MPNRARYQREKIWRLLEASVSEWPEHIKISLGKPSPIDFGLEEFPAAYFYRGLQHDEHGNVWLPRLHGKAANDIRRRAALQKALELEQKYQFDFWKRGRTVGIVRKENIDATTLRRMRKRLKKSGQAKFCPIDEDP
jgi:hypothetical protein